MHAPLRVVAPATTTLRGGRTYQLLDVMAAVLHTIGQFLQGLGHHLLVGRPVEQSHAEVVLSGLEYLTLVVQPSSYSLQD